jgi:hypothetical protein
MAKQSISDSKTDRQNILNNSFAIKNIQEEIEGLASSNVQDQEILLIEDLLYVLLVVVVFCS